MPKCKSKIWVQGHTKQNLQPLNTTGCFQTFTLSQSPEQPWFSLPSLRFAFLGRVTDALVRWQSAAPVQFQEGAAGHLPAFSKEACQGKGMNERERRQGKALMRGHCCLSGHSPPPPVPRFQGLSVRRVGQQLSLKLPLQNWLGGKPHWSFQQLWPGAGQIVTPVTWEPQPGNTPASCCPQPDHPARVPLPSTELRSQCNTQSLSGTPPFK